MPFASKLPRRIPFASQLQTMIEPFPDLTINGTTIYCNVCKCRLFFREQRQCEIHLKTRKHSDNKRQGVPRSEFLFDLCIWLCTCNIPFRALEKPKFHYFFKSYIPQWPLPVESYVRRSYVPRVYNDIINSIKQHVQNRYVYLTVEEVRDRDLNQVVQVIIRSLGLYGCSPPLLLGSKRLEMRETVENVVRDVLLKFDIQPEKVLVLATNSTASMLNVANALKRTHSHLVHVTCLARAFHKIAEEIQNQYEEVDKLVFRTKQIFANSPNRRRIFITTVLHVPMPPTSIHMNSESWIRCVVYYAKYFQQVKAFILKLNPEETPAIRESQHCFRSSIVEKDVYTIARNYECLSSAIQKLESESVSIHETFSIIDDVRTKLDALSDASGNAIRQKFYSVLTKNPGYTQLRSIHESLCNEGESTDTSFYEFYRYTPLTSIDLERSYFNNTYRPYYMRFTSVSLEKILCILMYVFSLEKQNPSY